MLKGWLFSTKQLMWASSSRPSFAFYLVVVWGGDQVSYPFLIWRFVNTIIINLNFIVIILGFLIFIHCQLFHDLLLLIRIKALPVRIQDIRWHLLCYRHFIQETTRFMFLLRHHTSISLIYYDIWCSRISDRYLSAVTMEGVRVFGLANGQTQQILFGEGCLFEESALISERLQPERNLFTLNPVSSLIEETLVIVKARQSSERHANILVCLLLQSSVRRCATHVTA